MNIKDILKKIEHPNLYDKGTHVMWTDPYIAKFLLEAHINPEINVASRKSASIDRLVAWMIEQTGHQKGSVLDLGCGPGLYASRFAKQGYEVTGVDFSENSIDYAKKTASESGLKIDYRCQNYLDLNVENEFDIVMMIYCDFGVLSRAERDDLVKKIYKALKPGGYFIFDGLNEQAIKHIDDSKQWEMSEGGFWLPNPYVCLSQSFHFERDQAKLDQHVVIDEAGDYRLYRFWNHYFNQADVEAIFTPAHFQSVTQYNNLLANDGEYNDEGVSFYLVKK